MRKTSLLIVLVSLVLVGVQAAATPVLKGDLLELIDPERAAYIQDAVCSMVSSYDRTGDNNDGFDGTYSYIRKEGEDLVIFDAEGPGCVYRIWSADPLDGWVKFYFDGEESPRLEVQSFRDLFNGKVYPFITPLSQRFIGGWCSYVPMPFEKSLKIVAGGPVHFLQITWHKFPTAEGVQTFTPDYSREDRIKLAKVKRAWENLGQPPAPFPAASRQMKKTVRVPGGSELELAKLSGSGIIRAIRIKAESEDSKIGRKALFLVHVDRQKQPNVYSPLGDFFLDPYAVGNSKSLLVGKEDDTYYSYWLMPYASGASIKIENESLVPLELSYEVVYEPVDKLPEGMGRFFAWWHRQETVEGEFFPMLEAEGRGQWLGVSHAMQNEHRGVGFLEGDEMLWIDGRDNSHYNGTGTEDYFNGGWYFGGPGSAAYYGCGVFEEKGYCHAYRIHLTDVVPFQQKASILIEHGPTNSWPGSDYAGVTYWYAEPGTTHTRKPTELAGRMNRPDPKRGVTEAETLFDPNGKGKVVEDIHQSYCLSSGQAVSTESREVGESIALLVDTAEAGNHYLDIGFLKGPTTGIAQVLVDGQPIGESVDLYAEDHTDEVVRFGMTQELTAGKHPLTIKSIGKNSASTGAGILADYVILRPDLFYEAEHLQISSEGGSHEVRSHGPEFSNMKAVWFTGEGPGSSVTIRVPVLKTGKQEVIVGLYKHRKSGIAVFKLNGNQIGEPLNMYEEWARFQSLSLGETELTAGDHEITIDIIGKDEKHGAYGVAIDWIRVR